MRKLTYANVMSTIAVFLALGGTSYALARNSVGNRELKASSVTSGKIRNGTIAKKDIAPAARGGARGPRGPEGAAGAMGARGPSEAWVARTPSLALSGQANVPTVVGKLDNLPAGDYVLSSGAQIVDFSNPGEIVSCDIRVNGQTVAGSAVVAGIGPGSARSSLAATTVAVTQASPFSATVECRVDQPLATPPSVHDHHLEALRVDKAHAVG